MKKRIAIILVLCCVLFGFYQIAVNFRFLQMPINELRFGIDFSEFSGTYTYDELRENNIFRYTKMSDMRKPYSFYDLTNEQSDELEKLLLDYSFSTTYYDSTGSGNLHYPDNSVIFSYNKQEDENYNLVHHGSDAYTCGIDSVVVTKRKVMISKRIFLPEWIVEKNNSADGVEFIDEVLISYECSDEKLLCEINKIIEEIKTS